MFESYSLSVRDRSIRQRTGGEQPKGAMPSFDDPSCVRSNDVPRCCAECAYGGGGVSLDRNLQLVCGHPNAPFDDKKMDNFFACASRKPWCPLAISNPT